MRRAAFVVIASVLLIGCATAAPSLPNPYTTLETERDRSDCLTRGGVWIETVDRYACRASYGAPGA